MTAKKTTLLKLVFTFSYQFMNFASMFFCQDPEAADDVVLLIKDRMSSFRLCQSPLVVLPAARLVNLTESLKVLPRNPLGERALHEFRKTAKAVAMPPWNMTDAAEYLNAWCQNNEASDWPAPIPLHFVMQPRLLHLIGRVCCLGFRVCDLYRV